MTENSFKCSTLLSILLLGKRLNADTVLLLLAVFFCHEILLPNVVEN